MVTKLEKECLRELVRRELENFKREQKTIVMESLVHALKADHDYAHFLERLMEKLK